YSSMLVLFLFYLKMLNLCGSALFAYTTLFRSPAGAALGRTRGRDGEAGRGGDRGGEDVPARPRHPRPAAPVHGRNRGGPLDQAGAGGVGRRDPRPPRARRRGGPRGHPALALLRRGHRQGPTGG